MRGVNCSSEAHNLINEAFSDWAKHVREGFEAEGINYFLDIYERVVKDAQSNRPYGYDEYVNDVSSRQALKIILDKIQQDENTEIFSRVDMLDNALKKTLRPLSDKELPNEQWQKKYPQTTFWWMYGLPKCVEY